MAQTRETGEALNGSKLLPTGLYIRLLAQPDELHETLSGPATKKLCERAWTVSERRKPRPDGKPGYIRVDTVHQGDQDGIIRSVVVVLQRAARQYIMHLAHPR